MKRMGIFGIISVLLGVLALVISKHPEAKQISPVLTPQQLNKIPKTVNGIPSFWHLYRSETNGFMIKHPLDVTAEVTSTGDHFYKLGATQSMGTELYDGISLLITSGRMDGKNLKEFVFHEYLIAKKDPQTETITEIKPVTIGAKEGFVYKIKNPSEKEVIYLPRENNKYLIITNSTKTPDNQSRNYNEVVTQMLSSIEDTKQTIQPIIEQ